jgi:hypothetical protein
MAKRKPVSKESVQQEEIVDTPVQEIQQQDEKIVEAGNKVRKAKSFGAILKGISEVRKLRLKRFKDEQG